MTRTNLIEKYGTAWIRNFGKESLSILSIPDTNLYEVTTWVHGNGHDMVYMTELAVNEMIRDNDYIPDGRGIQ